MADLMNNLISAAVIIIVLLIIASKLTGGNIKETLEKITDWFRGLGKGKKPKVPEFETIYEPRQ